MKVTLQELRAEAARVFGEGAGVSEGRALAVVPHQTHACYCYLIDPVHPKHPSMALYGSGRSKMGARRSLLELLRRVAPNGPAAQKPRLRLV